MQATSQYTVVETLYERDGTTLYRGVGGPDRTPVVLKVLDPRRCRAKAVARLRREFEVGRSLDLPAVVKPLSIDRRDGQPVLVLEDFGGQPLERMCREPMEIGRFPPQ